MKKKVLPLAVGAAAAVTMSAAQAAMYVNTRAWVKRSSSLFILPKTATTH